VGRSISWSQQTLLYGTGPIVDIEVIQRRRQLIERGGAAEEPSRLKESNKGASKAKEADRSPR